MTPIGALMRVYQCSDQSELQLYVTLNPSLENIVEAMKIYAEDNATRFCDWALEDSNYAPAEYGQWQHVVKIKEKHLHTHELYKIFSENC
jgi:hypothetical protein